jgi:DNA-binding CsgD family transcriptional regulator
MAAFDIVADAIPGSETKVMHLSGVTPVALSPWIGRGIDPKWFPYYEHYVTECDTQQRAIIDPMTMRQKPVYRHEELILPHWERSETYNELYRHWGCHHVLYVWGLDAGQFMGGLPIWRSATMRPFTNDDVRFATTVSALVGHALSVARELESRHAEGERFIASGEQPAGLITIAGEGRILAMDRNARQIFGPLAVFQRISQDMVMGEQIAPFLRYIGRTLRDIFSHHADGGSWLPPPSACLYLHRSGIALRFHGFIGEGEEGNNCYSVLVETGQIASDRRRRLMLRFGLSPRELDVLRVAGEGRRGAEAAAILGVEPGTFHKYVRQVSEKLGVAGALNLRSLARELAL